MTDSKKEFQDNKLKDTPEDRDIWDKLLASEESQEMIENLMKEAQSDEENGNLSPMDD